MATPKQPNDTDREREIFLAALEKATRAERIAYLDAACQNKGDLRARVEGLLENHLTDSFLEQPGLDGETVAVRERTASLTEGPGTVIDRYKLLQKLGEGGFGAVYMAEQKEPVKRRVALKIIKLGMDTKQVVARFEAERQALAMMDHLNIARVLDAGATETGRPFFVMELVRGIAITKYCDENQLTTQERLELFMAVCQAVQHAHQKGIIHRDLKPSNILVTLHDGVPVPKVIDFGIAKATQTELTEKTVFTQFQQMIGTPAYMSPEQAEMSGLDIDTRTDIYSLGVLLYELLTGRTPLDEKELLAGGYDEIRRQIKEKEPVKPSTRARTLQGEERTTVAKHRKVEPSRFGNDLKGDLDWIVMKALEKDRTRRYDTTKGFANDIRRCLNHEPVEAAAPNPIYLCRKFVRRHKAGLAMATAVTGLLVGGTVISTWQAIRATQANTKEKAERQRAEAAERRANQETLAARHNLYVSDIHLARQALETSDIRRAHELLERHVPRDGVGAANPANTPGQDLRGWEWRYLWSQLQTGETEIFATLPGPVQGLALSPDGRHLVASTTHGLVKLWEFPSGREVATLEPGNGGNTKAVFFPDNSRLLYNHVTRSTDQVSGVLRIWDLRSRRVTREIPYPGVVGPKLISPDGQRLLFGVVPDVYKLFDLRSGMAPWEVRSAIWRHSGDSFLFSESDGREWILGDANGHINIFNATTGERLDHWPAHAEKITALRFSPDGRLLVSASGYLEKTIKLWNYRTRELVGEFKGHQSWVSDLEFTSDGRRLISASGDQTVRLWDVATLAELAVFRGQEQEVWEVELSPDDRKIIAGVKDGTICVWDVTGAGREDSSVIASDIAQFALAQSGTRMAVLSKDGSVRTGTLQDDITLTPADFAGPDNACVSLSADGHQLILGKTNGAVTVRELATGEITYSNHLHHAAICSARLLASRDRILSRDREGNILLQKIGGPANETLWSVSKDPMETSSYFRGFAVSPDERTLATASYSGLVSLRDLATGRQIGTFQNPSPDAIVSDARFSPDGVALAIADAYGVVGLWDVATRRRLLALQGHRNAAGSLCFSPDGERLVSGAGAGESLIIWDLATQQELLRLQTDGTIQQLAFSQDGNRLFALSSTGDLYAWRAPP